MARTAVFGKLTCLPRVKKGASVSPTLCKHANDRVSPEPDREARSIMTRTEAVEEDQKVAVLAVRRGRILKMKLGAR